MNLGFIVTGIFFTGVCKKANKESLFNLVMQFIFIQVIQIQLDKVDRFKHQNAIRLNYSHSFVSHYPAKSDLRTKEQLIYNTI